MSRLTALALFLSTTSIAGDAAAQSLQWIQAGDLPSNHILGAIARLPSGRWIIAGGYTRENGGIRWQEASTIRTSSGGWIRGPSLPDDEGHRQQRHLVVLDDGSLLFAGEPEHLGGHPHDRTAHRYFEISGTWEQAGVCVRERYGAKLVKLSGGDALFIGGYNGHAGGAAIASTERYTPSDGRWTVTATMAASRAGADAVVLTTGPNAGHVLVCGGFSVSSGNSSYLDTCELYDPSREVFAPGPSLNVPRTGGTAIVLSDGRVVLIGGRSAPGQATVSTEIYDPGANTWTETASMATARGEVIAALLPDGDIVVAGGWQNSASEVLDSVERFEVATETWSPMPALPEPRSRHVLAVLANGDVLVAGGTDIDGAPLSSAVILTEQAPGPDAGVMDSGIDGGVDDRDSGPGAAPPGGDDDSGCSCRQEASTTPPGWWLWLGLLGFLWRRIRRSRARSA